MNIQQLHIEDLRNIALLDLTPSPGLNYFVGGNGVGKTSILEAVYLLGFGQSFRHAESAPLIRSGSSKRYCLVSAELQNQRAHVSRLGIQRDIKGFIARQDGAYLKKRSQLLKALPIQLLLPSSHELVEKGPEMRRRFLDQGLFHVEPKYHLLALEYLRILKQRNAALRIQDEATARSFNHALVETAERLTGYRQQLVTALTNKLETLLPQLGANWGILEISFRPGWKDDDLWKTLARQRALDLKMGYTHSGPHRAEMRLIVAGYPAPRVLSRGQQKLLVYALTLAYLEILEESGLEAPVLLIDDINAEFDQERIKRLLNYLRQRQLQVWVTALETGPFVPQEGEGVFHVEQLLRNL